jgi:S1-C subfamily serine protease
MAITILALLIIVSGGLAYYSFNLNMQLNDISRKLSVYQQEQASRISGVKYELTDFREEALSELNAAREDIVQAKERIQDVEVKTGQLEKELDDASVRMETLEDKTSASIDDLRDELVAVSGELSQSMRNAGDIFFSASQATVRISNGENTVGSAFLLDTEGYLITANHVLESLFGSIYVRTQPIRSN